MKPPPSGHRTAGGVASIFLAAFELLQFVQTGLVAEATGSGGFALLAGLFLAAALGSTGFGIALLAARRCRRRAVPLLTAGFAALAAVLCLADVASVDYSPDVLIPTLAATLVPTLAATLVPTLAATLVPALAVLVLIGAGLVREKADSP